MVVYVCGSLDPASNDAAHLRKSQLTLWMPNHKIRLVTNAGSTQTLSAQNSQLHAQWAQW
jgi:hypothetical protein